jgi:hypothetical protein
MRKKKNKKEIPETAGQVVEGPNAPITNGVHTKAQDCEKRDEPSQQRYAGVSPAVTAAAEANRVCARFKCGKIRRNSQYGDAILELGTIFEPPDRYGVLESLQKLNLILAWSVIERKVDGERQGLARQFLQTAARAGVVPAPARGRVFEVQCRCG